jgi:hypothetical protein
MTLTTERLRFAPRYAHPEFEGLSTSTARFTGRVFGPPDGQRVLAEQWLQRFVAQRRAQGKPLEPWVLALYHGQARRLARNPPTSRWATRLRAHHRRGRPTAPPSPLASRAVGAIRMVAGPLPHFTPSVAPLPVSCDPVPLTPPLHTPSRLDVRGITRTGTDGAATAQAILRDLANHAFGCSPLFSEATMGQDLPRAWAWHLEVVPVP